MSLQYASCPIVICIFMNPFFDQIGIAHSYLISFLSETTSRHILKGENHFIMHNTTKMNDSPSKSKGELKSSSPCLLKIGGCGVRDDNSSSLTYIKCLAPILDCRPFPPSDTWPTAFNNTSVQFILVSDECVDLGRVLFPVSGPT